MTSGDLETWALGAARPRARGHPLLPARKRSGKALQRKCLRGVSLQRGLASSFQHYRSVETLSSALWRCARNNVAPSRARSPPRGPARALRSPIRKLYAFGGAGARERHRGTRTSPQETLLEQGELRSRLPVCAPLPRPCSALAASSLPPAVPTRTAAGTRVAPRRKRCAAPQRYARGHGLSRRGREHEGRRVIARCPSRTERALFPAFFKQSLIRTGSKKVAGAARHGVLANETSN